MPLFSKLGFKHNTGKPQGVEARLEAASASGSQLPVLSRTSKLAKAFVDALSAAQVSDFLA
jgi:hypothetical protein